MKMFQYVKTKTWRCVKNFENLYVASAEKKFQLTIPDACSLSIHSSGVRKNGRGNPVEFGDGPAAVTGDERCTMSLTVRLGRRSQ